jgi:hypothetical protein
MRALFFKISKVALGACALATLVQMFLPPDVPPPIKNAMLASQFRVDLEGAAIRHQPPFLQYSDEQLNEFLVYALKPKQKVLDKPLLDFRRAIVLFHEGALTLTMERSFFGYSVYTTWIYAPKIADGKLSGTTKGGRVGRLPIHPQVAQFMGVLFADLGNALERELKLAAKLKSVEVHEKSVLLSAQ